MELKFAQKVFPVENGSGTKFQLKLTASQFWNQFIQKIFPVENGRGAKLQPKLTTSQFWTQLAQQICCAHIWFKPNHT